MVTTPQRRANLGMLILLGWYIVFAVVGIIVVNSAGIPARTWAVALPGLLLVAVIVGPAVLAILINGSRHYSAFALGTIPALACVVVLALVTLIARLAMG